MSGVPLRYNLDYRRLDREGKFTYRFIKFWCYVDCMEASRLYPDDRDAASAYMKHFFLDVLVAADIPLDRGTSHG